MELSQALRVGPHEVIAFVGAGGKTTAMFRLADELRARGKRVVTTTTTRLFAAQVGAPLRYDGSPGFLVRVHDALAAHPHVSIVGKNVEADKVAGVPPEFVDELAAQDEIDAVIYEADGARRLPFKAPAAHEPVLAKSTSVFVPVVGITALGAPLDDAHVHRAEIAARLAGARIGDALTPTMVARVIAHADGGLKGKPTGARAISLINQVGSAAQLDAARSLARLLLGYQEIDAVAMGAVQNASPVRETHRRVAAMVLAAGGSTRMRGRVKQLLPWRDKTLIENAIGVATASAASEVLVILGAHADKIRPLVQRASARVVINRDWETGQASSIRAALNARSPKIGAAIFINADQPLLTTAVIDQIIQRYRETDAPIVAPLYAGTRGSPVLFDHVFFDELKSLQGEQGGRALLAKYREQIQWVEFADARLAQDIDTPEEYENILEIDSI
ncbi:MAG: putative selenium-dependent hydroxylase accessory protein YqeC [Chloroflexota bacterium]|nr:putative selenium-dependent hydroxylase accessory protein YqeC [Chloroflexota bacterium]